MAHNITVPGGSTVTLKTAGKYCDRDIVVTAEGGGVETCTVNILDPDANYTDTPFVIHYVAYENDSVQMKCIFDPIKDQGDGTGFCELKNVVKGSKITFGDPKYECYPFVITGQYIENDCFVVDSEMLDNWQIPLLSTIVLGNADCWITPE